MIIIVNNYNVLNIEEYAQLSSAHFFNAMLCFKFSLWRRRHLFRQTSENPTMSHVTVKTASFEFTTSP